MYLKVTKLDIVYITGLMLLIFGAYHNVLSASWRYDDQFIIEKISHYPQFEYLFDKTAWQTIFVGMFTPLMLFSYHVDLIIFNFNPEFFYWHQLIAISLLSIAVYFLLNLWLNKHLSILAASLFVIGTPIAIMANQLMTRHYIEGALLFILSIILFVLAVQKQKKTLLVISAISFFLAISAKEIFVPGILLYFLIPIASLKQRLHYASYLLIPLGLYLLWRWHMLDILVGGYGNQFPEGNVVSLFLHYLWQDFYLLFKAETASIVIILSTSILIYLYYQRQYAILLFTLIFCALLPLFLIKSAITAEHSRLLLIVWLVFCLFVATILNQLIQQKKLYINIISLILVSILFFISYQASQHNLLSLQAQLAEYDAYSQTYWQSSDDVIIKASVTHPEIYTKFFEKINQRFFLEKRPQIFTDYIFLKNYNLHNKKIVQFSQTCQCMQDISEQFYHAYQTWKSSQQKNKPLSVFMKLEDSFLQFQFSPYTNGVYYLISKELGKLPFAQKSRFFIGNYDLGNPAFYIRYDSPEGWVTYSPLLHFDPSKELNFKRI